MFASTSWTKVGSILVAFVAGIGVGQVLSFRSGIAPPSENPSATEIQQLENEDLFAVLEDQMAGLPDRFQAAERLRMRGQPVRERLEKNLDASDASLRRLSLSALKGLSHQLTRWPRVLELTRDPEESVAIAAFELLESSPGGESVVEALWVGVRSGDPDVRAAAAQTVGRLKPPLPTPLVMDAYLIDNNQVRDALRSEAAARPELVLRLLVERIHAFESLDFNDPLWGVQWILPPEQGVELANQVGNHPSLEVRARAALNALGLGGDPDRFRDPVQQAIRSEQNDPARVRQWVEAVPRDVSARVLRDLLTDSSSQVRVHAALNLWPREGNLDLVAPLIEGLDDPKLRAACARCLGAVGPAAMKAVPRLTRLRDDPEARSAVRGALFYIQVPETREADRSP